MSTYETIFSNKTTVQFVLAHPDDVDVYFGGLISRLALDNKNLHFLITTSGARGSRDNVISEKELSKARQLEQIAALKELGIENPNLVILQNSDGEIENNMKLIGDIAFEIRRNKPDIVCTFEPNGYYFALKSGRFSVHHRDHRITGISTFDAVYPFSRDRSFFPEQLENGLDTHTVMELFFVSDKKETNSQIDITNVISKKKKALLSHKSQFSPDLVDEIISDFQVGNSYIEYGEYIQLGW